MDRDTALRWSLAVFLVFCGSSVSASSLSSFGHESDAAGHVTASPSAWTSQLGAVDRHSAGSDGRSDVPAVWDGAVATYNMLSAPDGGRDPSVFVREPVPHAAPATRATAIAESIRAVALPAPMAWWLLLAGLVGVVGISRRRIA
jgi:hypothetical protein